MKLILTGLIFLGYSLGMATKINPDGILGHPSLNASYSNSPNRGIEAELFDFGAAMPITPSFTFLAGYNYQEFEYETYYSRSETEEIYNYVGGFKYYSQAVDSLDDMVNPDGANSSDGKYNTVVTTLTLFAGSDFGGGSLSIDIVASDHITPSFLVSYAQSDISNTLLVGLTPRIHLFNQKQNLKHFNPNGSSGTITLEPRALFDLGKTRTNIAGLGIYMPFNHFLTQGIAYNRYFGEDKYGVFSAGFEVSF